MLKISLYALFAFVFVGTAVAQEPSATPTAADPAEAPAIPRVSLAYRPALKAVQEAFVASGLDSVASVLVVDYDAKGVILNVFFDKASGDEALDRAILDWGKQARVTPGVAGRGKLPFRLVNGDTSSAPKTDEVPIISMHDMGVNKPSLVPVMQAMARSNVSKADVEIMLDYNAFGDVTHAEFTKKSGITTVDQAILKWVKQLKLKPGAAGTGRLPFKLKKD